jgi:translation initiation factor 2B subunit (eIF-2B alpha/beta/delta family)
LTHCHSGSAIKTIIANKAGGKDFLVYNTETRPLYQGRKTAKDFLDAGMKITMVVDSSAPFILDRNDPFGLDIDAVVIGCDALKLDGSVINKIGSYSICSAACSNKIPVYIAGNLLKSDVHDDIHIETRKGEELWPDKPEGLEIINFAFDQVPPKFITGIITEFGIIKPSKLASVAKKHYPWMFENQSRKERH